VNVPGAIDDLIEVPTAKGDGWGIEASWLFWEAVATGKAKATDIGNGKEAKEVVAKSMKGSIVAVSGGALLHYGQEVIGAGKISLKLDKKLTKLANEGNMTAQDASDEIVADLPEKPKFGT
jgi:hypothetical protein